MERLHPEEAQPTLLADYHCQIGEGPLWHAASQCVYWTDIQTGRLFRYHLPTGKSEQFYQGKPVGGFTFQEDGSLLLFQHGAVVHYPLDGREPRTLIEETPDRPLRFNDVIADPAGRVFAGTLPTRNARGEEREGCLYRLELDGSLTCLLTGIGCSNGMGFTLDLQQMYYTDSAVRRIYLFDYDQATGELSHSRLFVQVPPTEGLPDGLTVDAQGYVWSAQWYGAALVRYAPDGRVERRIAFPVQQVSSVTFGGPDYTDIFVTTAATGLGQADDLQPPGYDIHAPRGGGLYHLNLGLPGRPEFPSRIET
jgi:D-xylonolactonase